MEFLHYPVMHQEVLDNLTIPADRDAVMIDCTTGEGGHTKLFLDTYPNLKVVGIDRDSEIQKKAIERFKDYGDRFTPVNAWFNDYLSQRDGESADAILFDLGISIFHYEESSRGFSFRKEEKLDMRLDESQSLSAESIVNEYSEEALADVIYKYGEERYSRRIARTIVEKRKEKKILPEGNSLNRALNILYSFSNSFSVVTFLILLTCSAIAFALYRVKSISCLFALLSESNVYESTFSLIKESKFKESILIS